ncbi:hypothetical protein SEA_FORZA_54 [Gordonia phage Forza]|uniref:Uncharacterized protein n=1 Tax=Gordonia phage Forza TaxID=2571247 RepID=A0A650EY02_9CAUD|nr:hypothetical protein PP303_gp054 [Gordonia phage Forza]QEM41524.1 hypothetical protein SEA_BOOPY_55 [Gordonia phage Boopy]QGT55047.1 hypothetical protein SEA_FORZA_54 [Gordonia phage Forza]UXE04197.1 hypothetical protein SEA_BLUENGOLD_53 [Gordonia phage BlueNGold]WBF03836.1 hypothetical protein SEA_MAREELIH_53 [Gordonia phage Mareelih]
MATTLEPLRCPNCHCFISRSDVVSEWDSMYGDTDGGYAVGADVLIGICNNTNCDGRDIHGHIGLGLDTESNRWDLGV